MELQNQNRSLMPMLKKVMSVVLAVIMIMSTSSIALTSFAMEDGVVSAEDYFEYSIEDDTAVITRYNGAGPDVIIPEILDGYRVERIEYGAFYNIDTLRSVTIPASIKDADMAFSYCENLENIYVDQNNETYVSVDGVLFTKDMKDLVTYPGAGAAEYEIPYGVVNICYDAFAGSSIAQVAIPDTVEVIGQQAFESSDITSVTIPSGVSRIESYAFAWCKNLSEVIFENGVESIGFWAFAYCTDLKSINIPESVNEIKECAFSGLTNLEEITVDENNAYYSSENNVLFNKDKSVLIQYAVKNENTSYEVPDSVKRIEDKAFLNVENLENISISENVTSIGGEILCGTAYYQNEDNWEDNCLYLGAFVIDSRYDDISDYTIYYVKEGTKYIADSAFTRTGDYGDIEVNLPDGLLSIGKKAFAYTRISDIDIPESVKNIEYEAFSYSSFYHNSDNWTDNALYIDDCLIYCDSSFESFAVEDGTRLIAEKAFENMWDLREITLPASIENINTEAFSRTDNLSYVYYNGNNWDAIDIAEGNEPLINAYNNPGWNDNNDDNGDNGDTGDNGDSDVEVFVEGDYSYCINEDSETVKILKYNGSDTECVIPGTLGGYTVTDIGEFAFESATFESVEIPESVTTIGYSAFSNCSNLTEIVVDEDNDYYSSEDGVLFNKDKTELIFYPRNKTNETYEIPETVTTIGVEAFYGARITNVEIPESVTTICDYGFYNCYRLESLTIPKNVTSIGRYAVGACYNLTEILVDAENNYYCSDDGVLFNKDKTELILYPVCKTNETYKIPESVTTIGENAFFECSNLVSVEIPESVTTIDEQSIFGCYKLTEIVVDADNNYYCSDNGVLFNKDKTVLIVYPIKKTGNSYVIPDTVEVIGWNAFRNCGNLTRITIPCSVTTIKMQAFGYCYSLTEVFFLGSEEQWNNIEISSYDNEYLMSATRYYCIHANTVAAEGSQPTCTESGYTEGVYCNDCENWIEGHETIAAKHTDTDFDNICDICEKSINDITIGQQLQVTVNSNEITYLSFVPSESGIYSFYSISNMDTYGYLFDSDKNEIARNDDSYRNDFVIEYYLEAGVTYYFGAGFWSDYSGSYDVKLIQGSYYGEDHDGGYDQPDYELGVGDYFSQDGFEAVVGENNTCVITYIYNYSSTLTIPSTLRDFTVTGFTEYALYDYGNNVEEINIPATVTTMPVVSLIANGFGNLKTINVEEGNPNYSSIDGVLYNADGTEILVCPNGFEGEFTITENITELNSGVFAKVNGLTGIKVVQGNTNFVVEEGILFNADKTRLIRAFDVEGSYVMPETVETIDECAFIDNDNLESITFSENVNSIVYAVFYDCNALAEVNLPANLQSIGMSAFENCESMKDIDLGENLKEISHYAFMNSGLESIVLPDTLQSCGDKIFENCSELAIVDFGAGLNTVSYMMFANTSSLKTITFPENIKEIRFRAFYRSGIENLDIPDNVESIEEEAFSSCNSLETVKIGNGTKYMNWAFTCCNSLVSVKIGSGVDYMRVAFFGCKNLESVEFAEGFNGEMEGAFRGCVKLTDVELPSTVQRISYAAFRDSESLESVDLPENLSSVGGHAFDNTLWYNKQAAGDAYLDKVLYNYKGEMPDKYTLEVKDGTEIIADYAFEDKTSLTSVVVNDGMQYIGTFAFYNTGIKSIVLPETLIRIDYAAFMDCNKIADVYYSGTKEQWNEITIEDGNESLMNANIHFSYCYHKNAKAFAKVDATCTKSGYTAGTFCNDCETWIDGHETITAKGHSYSSATCTKAKTCKTCGATSGKANGHNYAAATCTKAKTCKTCGVTSGKANGHKYSNVVTKATLTKSGKIVNKCSVCGNVSKTTTVYYPKTIKLSATSYTYDGKAKTPSVTVKDSAGKTLKSGTDYTVTYASGRKSVGQYKVTITFKGNYSGTKTLTFNILPSKTSKITVTPATTTLKATWSKVTGATGYKVELLNSSGKVVKSATTTKLTYTFSKLTAGTNYKVKVTAYKTISGKNQYSTVSTTLATATKVATPTLKVTSKTKGTANLTWTNVAGENGYEVYYSTSKSSGFKSVASYKTNVAKGSKSKLTSKKTYYFKVRAFKTVNGKKVYGDWSKVVSVKVK